jgi:hydroxyacylglutathione hydrolase
VLPQPDDMLVLPGHGETTTIGVERRVNPFLQGLVTPGTRTPGAGS